MNGRPARRPERLAVLLIVASLCGACGGERDPARALLTELEASAEARDASRLFERVSDGFEGPDGMLKLDALQTARRYLAAYESVSLEIYEVEVQRETRGARVRCLVAFTGSARKAFGLQGLLPPSAVYRFDLRAREEGGVWRVARASWQEAEAPEPR